MEKKIPLSVEQAIHLLRAHEQAARAAGRKGTDRGHLCWYAPHFVEWLTEIGYHIELTGDEFEPATMCRQIV